MAEPLWQATGWALLTTAAMGAFVWTADHLLRLVFGG
jgi:preprotein translocase subunit SecE